MNRSYDSDDDLQDLREPGGRDKEISLGTSMILGIFFVLTLLCAVFFGFGYSMGRRSAQTVAATAESATSYETGGSKPAPGSAASRASSSSHSSRITADTGDDPNPIDDPSQPSAVATATIPSATTMRPGIARAVTPAPAPPTSVIKPVSMPRPATALSNSPSPVAVPGMGTVIVQIAAVSHQEDADMLINALKKRGYSVAIRQEPQDKLLHVQLGPFASKKDAEAMRQRLLTDGYNAIVK